MANWGGLSLGALVKEIRNRKLLNTPEGHTAVIKQLLSAGLMSPQEALTNLSALAAQRLGAAGLDLSKPFEMGEVKVQQSNKFTPHPSQGI